MTTLVRRWSVFVMSVLAAALYVSGHVRHAAAAEPAAAVTLLLELDGEPRIGAERLREMLASELDRPVVLEPDAEGGTLDVQQSGARALVYFETAAGQRTGRSLELPTDPEQAARAIALLAENLMQDASPYLAAVDGEAANADAEPSATPAAATDSCPGASVLPVGMDFIPYLGTSSTEAGRSSGRNFSFGLVGAMYEGVDGLALSGTANIDTRSACGIELAGVANITLGSVAGLQLAGVANVAAEVRGAQISGTLNIATKTTGLQLGAIDITTGPVRGAQIGVVTFAEETDFSLGVVNVTTGRVRGLQVGVVNYARDTDFSLGILNIVADGRWHMDAWMLPEAGMLLAAVKHGGDHFHYLYGAGVRPLDADHVWPLLGLGGHVPLGDRLFFDQEVISHTEVAATPNHLVQARLRIGYRFSPKVAGLLGPTMNLLVADAEQRTGVAPAYRFELRDMSDVTVFAWPGVAVGVQVL
jgi:hypothetical protein